ncbi:MAG: flagellar basal body rod protein FlgC [Planctomycetes bacterium]|nr:flagellar basal body rod protein FlgC [Planctomycetota bacterium]
MYGAFDISTSALVAQRTNLDVIAGNIAMQQVTRDENGNPAPYRRRVALFAPGDPSRGRNAPGVHVAEIVEDYVTPLGLRWDPGHVDAIKTGESKGYVRTSNVDYHTEMVNAMVAQRAYEANVTVIEMAKSMARSTLRLIA